MKTISHTSRSKDKLLHIETDLGIINIRTGLRRQGKLIERIDILPDVPEGCSRVDMGKVIFLEQEVSSELS